MFKVVFIWKAILESRLYGKDGQVSLSADCSSTRGI